MTECQFKRHCSVWLVQVVGEDVMVFFKDNGTARDDIVFDLYMMSKNKSFKVDAS